jgi:hypothetical protein
VSYVPDIAAGCLEPFQTSAQAIGSVLLGKGRARFTPGLRELCRRGWEGTEMWQSILKNSQRMALALLASVQALRGSGSNSLIVR